MHLSKFENEILAMGRYLEKVYKFNVYGEHSSYVDEYLKKEGVSLDDLPLSKNITLNFKSAKDKKAYIAQAMGLLSRILPA